MKTPTLVRVQRSQGWRCWAVFADDGRFVMGRKSWTRARTLDVFARIYGLFQAPQGYAVMTEEQLGLVMGFNGDAKPVFVPGGSGAYRQLADIPEGKEKPYLSSSQIDLACKCGEAYRRRYIEGEKIPPGMALLRGRGVHGAAKTNFRQKKDSGRDLPVSDIVEAAVATFETDIQRDGVSLSAEEQARGATVVIGETKDQTARLAKGHAELQAPDYQPALVEERVRILVPNNTHDLLGVVDLVDQLGRVIDFKTGAKKRTQKDADASTQLSMYGAAAAALEVGPSELRLDVLVNYKKGVGRQILSTMRGPKDYVALVERINAVLHTIEAGTFLPPLADAWWCDPKWCGYYRTCRFVNSDHRRFSV